VIPPNSMIATTLTFLPTATGPTTETLTITSSDPHHPSVGVGLFGRGKAGFMVLPTGLFFGKVGIGVAPTTGTFNVVNAGLGKLKSWVVFSVTSGEGVFTLLPGHSHPVTVRFAPSVVGPNPASLLITSDDPTPPSVNLPIGGKGVPGNLTIDLPPSTL